MRELVGPRPRDPPELAGCPRRARLAARRAAPRRGRLRRASRSRPGRTSPTSPHAGSTRSTSGPGATRFAHTADEQVEIAELERTYAGAPAVPGSERRRCSCRRVLAELAQYPFARLDDWRAEARARGIELIDFGVGDPREVTPPFIRDALVGRRSRSAPRTRARPACRSSARRSRLDRPALRRRASTPPSRSSRRSARRRRSSRSRTSRSASGASSRSPSPGTRSTSAARSSRAATVVHGAAARGDRLAARPRRVRRLGRDRALLDLLPEQPDRSDRAARASTRSSPAAPASTASCSAPTRRTRSSGSTRPPRRRSRSRTARTSSSSTRSRSARR